MTIRGWGRYSDICIYNQVRSIIFGSKFQKSNTFGSMMICGFFFFGGGGGDGGGGGGGHYEFGLFFLFIYLFFFFWGGGGSFLYIIGLFKVKIQNGNIFWAAKFQKNYRYACYS